MKLCMIGTGYVGLVSGVCFSDLGNDVICVDKDNNKINNLKNGKIPIYEPGLEELVRKNLQTKRLNFSTNLKESVSKSDIIFICVGTPTKKNSNSADLTQVYSVGKENGYEKNLRDWYKALSWRLIAMGITAIIALLVTGNYELAAGIAVADSIVKILAYVYHERLWRWLTHKS